MDRESYMLEALALARKAAALDEVPVGCVVVGADGEVIGRGFNRREHGGGATAHAEIIAISEACAHTGSWRLDGAALYVTLEPCPMCAGAVINARIPVVVYGAKDAVSGSCGSVINLFEENYPHHPAVYGGVLGRECGEILSEFFAKLRPDCGH